MSQTTSATTGRRYGLERVCRLWEQSRSAFYARRARLQRSASAEGPCRRGPTPALSDAQLLAPFATTWPAPRSRARAIARSTRGCGSSTGCGSRARKCCA